MNNPHKYEHEILLELSKYPPLTKRAVRKPYLQLVGKWQHFTARHKFGSLITQAEEYFTLSEGSPENAHLYFFQRNKNENPDDYLTY